MKLTRIYTLMLMLIAANLTANAQNANAVLFTENGEKFTVILNGLRQNEKPETNVKIEGLNATFYKIKILFENAALGEVNQNLNIELGSETTYVIKQNSKKVYVVRMMSIVPLAEAPKTTTSTSVNTYNPNAPVYTPPPAETVTQQTTTTTTSGVPAGGVSMGVNVNDAGGSFSMNVSGYDNMGNSTTQQTTITTTTTSSSNYNSVPPPSAPAPSYLPGYSGAIGCPVPMETGEFQSMKSSIASKTFEDSKLTVAKQIINSNCLLAHQVKEIMMLFTYEDSKLDFAKYAYGRTYDIGNYYKVNDAFTFETSIDDLNAYINSGR